MRALPIPVLPALLQPPEFEARLHWPGRAGQGRAGQIFRQPEPASKQASREQLWVRALALVLVRSHFDALLGSHAGFTPALLCEWRLLDTIQSRGIAALTEPGAEAFHRRAPRRQRRLPACKPPLPTPGCATPAVQGALETWQP